MAAASGGAGFGGVCVRGRAYDGDGCGSRAAADGATGIGSNAGRAELVVRIETTAAKNVLLPYLTRAVRYDGYVDWHAQTRWELLLAAAASLNDGDAKLAEFKDPATGKPFVKQPQPGGFELQSKVAGPRDGKLVTLRVGRE